MGMKWRPRLTVRMWWFQCIGLFTGVVLKFIHPDSLLALWMVFSTNTVLLKLRGYTRIYKSNIKSGLWSKDPEYLEQLVVPAVM